MRYGILLLMFAAIGARAADNALERGLQRAGKAIEHGLKTTGRAAERGARAAQRGGKKVTDKIDEKVRPKKQGKEK